MIAAVIIFSFVKGKFEEFAKNPEKAAAEMMVSANPELEMVSQNDETGEMTIRTRNGEEMTLSYADISEGRIRVTDKDGNETRIGSTDLSRVPGWVPKAGDLSDAVSFYQSETGDEISGQFSGRTAASPEEIEAEIETQALALDMTAGGRSTMGVQGVSTTTLNFSGGGRELRVVITGRPGEKTQVNTNYAEKK